MIRLQTVERWWLRFGTAMLVAFFVIVVVDAFWMAHSPPSGMEKINPRKVNTTAPFDHPGVIGHRGSRYDVAIVAYTFGFRPAELDLPKGASVHFQITSSDVVHGYQIPGRTDVNAMVIPGYVTTVHQQFDKPGRYLVLCNEYCGLGHQHMTMHINVHA